jgi:hypothetical protein
MGADVRCRDALAFNYLWRTFYAAFVPRVLHPDFMRRIASQGGRARMAKMSPAERSCFQSMAAKAR